MYRAVRHRGNNLIGLNVRIIRGCCKGELGYITSGANGYYHVEMQGEKTAFVSKRTNELCPIATDGSAIPLPMSPADRRKHRQEASQSRLLLSNTPSHNNYSSSPLAHPTVEFVSPTSAPSFTAMPRDLQASWLLFSLASSSRE